MAKTLILFVLTVLTVILIGKIASYWILMIAVGLIAFLLRASPGASFLWSGLAFGLSWFSLTIWISIQSGSALPMQMAELMGLKNDNLLWFATGVLGFLLGGFSGMTGALFRKVFERKDAGFYRS